MRCPCPQCGFPEILEQDIEVLSDSVLLVKIDNRMQLRCQHCGWMGYGEFSIRTEDRPCSRSA